MPPFLTTDDAAAAAEVSPVTIRAWGRRGWLTRYGNRTVAVWDLKELAALLVRRG